MTSAKKERNDEFYYVLHYAKYLIHILNIVTMKSDWLSGEDFRDEVMLKLIFKGLLRKSWREARRGWCMGGEYEWKKITACIIPWRHGTASHIHPGNSVCAAKAEDAGGEVVRDKLQR